MPPKSKDPQPYACLLQKKHTKNDFRKESLWGMKKGLILLGEERLSLAGTLLGLSFRSSLSVGIAGYL